MDVDDEEHQKGDEDNDDAGDEEDGGGSGSGGGDGDDDGGEDDDGHDSTGQNDTESEENDKENDHKQGGTASDESRVPAPTFAELAIYARFDATKLPKSFSTLETRVKANLRMCVIRRHVVPRKASKTTIAKTGSKANRTTTSAYTLGLKEQIELRILGKPALLGSGLGDFAEVRTNLWELRATSGAKAWWQVARPTLRRQQTVSDRGWRDEEEQHRVPEACE
ncbi:BZ3500_MvSof-1268-A1-R1_Chr11-3g03538 [Microbotryum saponariae]|uniref:BZ3500_MvSof-1268-A1-R1_Chr11-3g03538 protein n=1 Tax=Microbotryum saponariae TaxID=289078 RepID=A0A2X0KQ45_9BASI|nr:BZ3500_MvSof-1268-A1-R1_Chr11-3g03538 [Microbotryum saponariae]SDA03547.1 BZ3501_MvSof-1269-A2-R1_Chr11g03115 [Microbotryum saponariae]